MILGFALSVAVAAMLVRPAASDRWAVVAAYVHGLGIGASLLLHHRPTPTRQ